MESTAKTKYPELMRHAYNAIRTQAVGEENIPSFIYHYTSTEAAQIILESDSLRFSHTYFMNDMMEIRKGLQIIFNSLDVFCNNQQADQDVAAMLGHLAYTMIFVLEDEATRLETLAHLEKTGLKDIHPKQFEQFQNFNQNDFFITCFSEEKDSLPMWYMYADNARGVALGFDFPALLAEHNKFTESHGLILSAKVIYDEKIFRDLVNKYIQEIFNVMIAFKKEHGDLKKLKHGEVGNDFYFSALYYLLVLAVSFKDESFKHEKEWRLFITTPRLSKSKNKKFAVHKGTLKPFCFLTYPTSNAQKLKKLIVGKGNPNSTEWLKVYLASINSSCEKIVLSTVPFRNV